MTHLKNEAERLRHGVQGGWLPISDAVAWAERAIAETAHPDAALIDVALAGNSTRQEVASLLRRVPGVPDANSVMRQCVRDLLTVIEQQPGLSRDAAQWLYLTAINGGLPEAEFGYEPLAVDDEFALADQGYSTYAAARARLLSFLREFANPKD